MTLNGQPLTEGEVMTLRVALAAYNVEMQEKNILGSDEIGEGIRRGYLECTASLLAKMETSQ